MRILQLLASLLLLAGCGHSAKSPASPSQPEGSSSTDSTGRVVFADTSLEAAVRQAVDRPTGTLPQAAVDTVTRLVARRRGIASLEGIGSLKYLQILDLADNQIQDLSPLAALTRLTFLELGGNRVSDLTPLDAMLQLEYLGLLGNVVRDITPVLDLPYMASLDLSGNPLDAQSSGPGLSALRARGVQVDYVEYVQTDTLPCWGGEIVFATEGGDLKAIRCGDTEPQVLTTGSQGDDYPRWSPGGRAVLFESTRERNAKLFVLDAGSGLVRRITDTPRNDRHPAWSPDGKRIAFDSDRDGNQDVYVIDADGSNPVCLTKDNNDTDAYPSWSPDGSRIAFSSRRSVDPRYPARYVEIYVMNADGTDLRRFTNGDGFAWHPVWSPDGRNIAYDFRVTGYDPGEIVVAGVTDSSYTRLPSLGGANCSCPTWSADGKRIAYQDERLADRADYLMIIDLGSLTRIAAYRIGCCMDMHPDWSK